MDKFPEVDRGPFRELHNIALNSRHPCLSAWRNGNEYLNIHCCWRASDVYQAIQIAIVWRRLVCHHFSASGYSYMFVALPLWRIAHETVFWVLRPCSGFEAKICSVSFENVVETELWRPIGPARAFFQTVTNTWIAYNKSSSLLFEHF